MRLLVNADDLGSSRRVNEQTLALMESGVLRSASILANAAAFEEAVSAARHFRRCSFGVHLNVTHGRPLADDPALMPILDAEGRFSEPAVRALSGRQSIRNAVFREWSRQLDRIRGRGISVSHIDSHDHIHLVPHLFGVLKRLQRKFGISRVRIPQGNRASMGGIGWRLKTTLWRNWLKLDGTRTVDLVLSLADYRKCCEGGFYPNARTIELVIHPGLRKYDEETQILASDWWGDQMRFDALIAYHEL